MGRILTFTQEKKLWSKNEIFHYEIFREGEDSLADIDNIIIVFFLLFPYIDRADDLSYSFSAQVNVCDVHHF